MKSWMQLNKDKKKKTMRGPTVIAGRSERRARRTPSRRRTSYRQHNTMNENNKSIIILALGLLGTEIAWKIWNILNARRRHLNNVVEEENNKKIFSEVLMFSEHSQLCRDHANTRISCDKKDCPVKNVRRIQSYMNGASSSLDVCMYVMTCDDLTKSIVAAHRRKVCVRIIVDSGMSEHPACSDQLMRMRRAGIKVRTNQLKTSSLMHHKFAIVDRKIVFLGSTNWTMQAFYGNYDSVMITNYKDCVTQYSEEFDKIWQQL